jgi:hypothetical protein
MKKAGYSLIRSFVTFFTAKKVTQKSRFAICKVAGDPERF